MVYSIDTRNDIAKKFYISKASKSFSVLFEVQTTL